MSSINPIGASPSASAQQRPTQAPPQKSAASSALEEANETIETTRREAAKGDQVAIRRLAKLHKSSNHGSTASSTPATKAHPFRNLSGHMDTNA